MYDSARSDFRRVEEATRHSNSDRLPPAFLNELWTINSVANELCLFLTARIELTDLYPSQSRSLKTHLGQGLKLHGLQCNFTWPSLTDLIPVIDSGLAQH